MLVGVCSHETYIVVNESETTNFDLSFVLSFQGLFLSFQGLFLSFHGLFLSFQGLFYRFFTYTPLYTDTRYNDTIRYNDDLTAMKLSLRR